VGEAEGAPVGLAVGAPVSPGLDGALEGLVGGGGGPRGQRWVQWG
jgi:hypothetical protein